MQSPSPNRKALKLRWTPRAVPLGFSNVTVHALFHRRDKRADFGGGSFRFELHTPIRQVLHKTRYFELFRHLQGLIAKTDTLHTTCEKHRFKLHFDHRGFRTVASGPRRIQSVKPDAPNPAGFFLCILGLSFQVALRSQTSSFK